MVAVSLPVTKIFNCRLLRNHSIVKDEVLYLRDGKIIDPFPLFYDHKTSSITLIDARNAIVVPGFIDLQINGALGVDFAEWNENAEEYKENLTKVAKGLLKYGCTSFLPTLISSKPEIYRKILPLLEPRKGTKSNGAEILGAHVEGPFISFDRNGAHDKSNLLTAPQGFADLASVYGISKNKPHSVKIITIAPEIEGVIGSFGDLISAGVTISIGHSSATVEQAEEAVANGAVFVTHLFNAMQPFHHRNPGIIGLLGTTRVARPYYGIICDGIHSHPNSVRIAFNAHKNAVLITDAVSAMGLPPGEYTIGDIRVRKIGDDRVETIGTGRLAGSAASLDVCVRNFKKFSGCSTVEALEAATLHPAQALGIQNRKGTLNFGADADLVFLDDDLNVLKCFVAGEEAWSR